MAITGGAVLAMGASASAAIPSVTRAECYGNGTSGYRSCDVGVDAVVPAGTPVPTGTVSWTSSGPDSQTVTASCELYESRPEWAPKFSQLATCQNGYMSPGLVAPRTEQIVVTYSGDARYAPSTMTTHYVVPDPNNIPQDSATPGGVGTDKTKGGAAGGGSTDAAGTTSWLAVSGVRADRRGVALSASRAGAVVIRIERREGRPGHRRWTTVTRLRRTLPAGSTRVAVRLRPGVHRISVGGAAVRHVERVVTVRG
jgi:hypothetical protein